MKRIIDGKVYNTETATHVATYYPNGHVGYNWTYNERYFKRRDGEIFVVHNGWLSPNAAENLEMRLSENTIFKDYIPCDHWQNFATRPFVETFI